MRLYLYFVCHHIFICKYKTVNFMKKYQLRGLLNNYSDYIHNSTKRGNIDVDQSEAIYDDNESEARHEDDDVESE